MNKYNIFDLKWIDVTNTENKNDRISLYEFLKHTNQYKSFNFSSPEHNISVFRMILALYYDYKIPDDEDELINFIKNKYFIQNADKIKDKNYQYFFLDDKTYPFMQMDSEKKTTSINKLFHEIPAGNNVTHFNHILKPVSVDVEEIIPVLLSHHLFVPLMGGGNPKGINGSPPLYFIINGANLYETLVLSMLHDESYSSHVVDGNIGEIESTQYIDITPNEYSSNKIPINKGYLWKSRAIQLIINEDKQVDSMKIAPGNKALEYWWDPMCSTKIFMDKDIPNYSKVTPDNFKPVWKGYSSFFLQQTNKRKMQFKKPVIIEQYENMKLNGYDLPDPISVKVFGYYYKNQGAFQGYIEDILYYSTEIAMDELLIATVDNAIRLTESCVYRLKKACYKIKRSDKSNSSIFNEGDEYHYWYSLTNDFQQIIFRLSNKENKNRVFSDWKIILEKHTWQVFNNLTNQSSVSARMLELYVKAESYLRSELYVLLKKDDIKEYVDE